MDASALVGRSHELDVLEQHLARARAGAGGCVLITGEAGAGKTALADALATRAQAVGVAVGWGACREGEGGSAYLPWLTILRALDPGGIHLLDSASSRFQLFDEISARVRTAAQPGGLLLVVDDLHWADVPSLRLMQFITADSAASPVLIVGVHREDFAAQAAARGAAEGATESAAVLAEMGRDRRTTRLPLGGLAPPEIAELAGRSAGRRLDGPLLDQIVQRSGGNPLYVTELARLIGAGRGTGLPATIRDLVSRRLDGCPPRLRELLREASVLGREFDPGLLAGLTGTDTDDVLGRLDQAAAAGLVERDGAGVRFGHVLTQEVLYAELPAARRHRLHTRAAELVGDADLDTLAYHLRQAVPLGWVDEAVAATRSAAARAFERQAYEHAAALLREALALRPIDPGTRAEILLDLARCELRTGAIDQTWQACRAAADIGRATGDPTILADAATLPRGVTDSVLTGQIHVACREALALIPADDLVRVARLLAQLAMTADRFATPAAETSTAEVAASAPNTAPEFGLRALAAAQECGDPQALALALHARHDELIDLSHVRERRELGTEAVRLGQEHHDEDTVAWGYTWRINAAAQLGDRPALHSDLAALATVVEHQREPRWQWRLGMIRACLALYEGRFDQARALATEALTIGERGGDDGAGFFDLVFRSALGLLTGDGLDEVEARVRRFVEQGPFLARGWLTNLLARRGDLEQAAALWPTIVPHLDAFPRQAVEWLTAAVGNAEVAAALGDTAAAKILYRLLEPFPDRYVAGFAYVPNHGPVALYLGMLAVTMGDLAPAQGHLDDALAAAQVTSSPPFEAVAHLWLARMRLRRGGPGDAAAADRHLGLALGIAQRIGMAPLAATAAALRAGSTSALTPREEQVAALVAEGLSNRQIGTRLRLSERTAENHVAHIMTKLGFDSRSRIASWWATRSPSDR